MFTSTLPRTWEDPVRRLVIWTTIVATIAWSLGLSSLINIPTARAAHQAGHAPVLSGGGPPDGQLNAPTDALIDISADGNLNSATVIAANVKLNKCTGATDAVSCTTPESANLCTTVSLGSNIRITCDHAALETNTTYRFRIETGVQAADNTALASAVQRIIRTTSVSGGTNTTPPNVLRSNPPPGTINFPVNGQITLDFPTGPEGNMKTGVSTVGSVQNEANFMLQAIDATTHAPSGADLCGTTGCTLTWDATGRHLLINPTDPTAGTEYQLQVTGLQNNANVAMPGPFIVRFTAGASDATAPTLKATCGSGGTEACTVPLAGSTAVLRNTPEFTVTVSEALDHASLTLGTTVGLYIDADSSSTKNGAETILGTNALTITFDAVAKRIVLGSKAQLAASTRYCFFLLGDDSGANNGVKDTTNLELATTSQNKCFTTGNESDTTAPALSFVDADNFKIVAKFSEALNATDAGAAASYSLECPLGVGVSLTGKTITYRPETKEVEIQGLGLAVDQTCRLSVASGTTFRDLGGNDAGALTADFKVLNSATTGGFIGTSGTQDFHSTTNFATFWEKPQRCQPRANATNKATSLECEFPAPTGATLASGSTFTLNFPAGFTFSTADGNTRAPTTSFWNADLNGPETGAPTITSVLCDATALTCTVTTGTASIAAGQMIHFELDRLTTPTTPGNDLRISVVVKDASSVKVGQTIQPMPFIIQQGGALSISGKVCKGTTSGGACTEGDTAIASVKVMCNQMGGFATTTGGLSGFMGFQDTTTNNAGEWTISGLTDGQYGCNVPPDPTRLVDTGGGNAGQMVTLAGASKTGVDFKYVNLAVTGKTLTVNVSGIAETPDDADADDFVVFCHAGFSSFEFSAPVMKAVDAPALATTTVSTTLKLQGGKTYECGLGPYMDLGMFGTGTPPPPPEFTFMPPKMQQVVVPTDANPAAITFALAATSFTISGTVVDGSATGIANVFIMADPVGCFNATTGAHEDCSGSFAQSKSDGTFTLRVGAGTYSIRGNAPGLPPSTEEIVTVTTANVTGVTLKIVKSSTTIAGQVLDESGNGIKYAHVNGEKRTITTGSNACDYANSRPAGGWADSPTDESGNFTLYASAGTWCVRAFAPAYGEVGTRTVTISGTTSQTGQNIQATSTDYKTISGTVTKGGTATGGAFVNCFGSSGGNHAQSGSDGTYRMKVKAGTGYTCDGYLPGVGPLPRVTGVNASADVTVNFAVGNPGTITVTITNITDAHCDARDASGFGSPAGKASSAGVYTMNVPAGTYTVRCGSPKYGELVNQASVAVTAGGTATATGTAPTTRTLAGRVTDGTNNVSGATLKLTETSSGKSFSLTTGSQGSTNNNLSATVPEGTYTVTAAKKGFEQATTTATVSGGNLTLTSPLALKQATGGNGTSVTIPVQASGSAYAGDAKVIATSGEKTIVAKVDATTGNASVPLTNGTWTVTAIGDNGKQATSTTVTVSGGVLSGSAPTLAIDTAITGYTDASQAETVGLTDGGLLKFKDLAVGGKSPEVNVPASCLSTSDSSTGKVEMASDPTLAAINPGADENFVGKSGYEISAKDANGNAIETLLSDITITIPYTDADVSAAGVTESQLKVAAYDTSSQTWESFPTTVDTVNNLLIATVSHLSSFGVIGGTAAGSPTVSDATPPAAVGSPAGSATANAVTLTWTDPTDSDLDSVEVLRNNPPSTAVSGVPLSRVAKGTKRFVDSTVTAGTSYSYILRTRDTAGNTRNSGEIAVTTPAAGAPATPAVVTAPPAATTTAPPVVTTPAAPAATAPVAPGLATIGLNAGDRVRSTTAKAVYLVGADGRRYVFPNEVTYKSWHADFSGVKTITDSQLASLALGGTVTVRPGTWLVKIESDPKVYAIEPGGTLRWVETEARARLLYGSDWNRQIIDVPVSYWPAYREGGALGSDRHPTGTVVRSGGQAYYIDAGKRRMVAADAFSSQGFQDRFVRSLAPTIVYEDGPALSSSANLKFASR